MNIANMVKHLGPGYENAKEQSITFALSTNGWIR